MGLVDPAWPLSPRPAEVKSWDSLTEEEKDRFDQIMSVYAAAVDHVDQSVGRLTAELTKRGLLDDTLILFLSDNGGNAESGPNGKMEGKGAPGSADSTVFCGQSWAMLENTPFRRYKHYNHEGGISTPLIAHWPKGIPARGALCREPGHLIDLMATCVSVSGAPYPSTAGGKAILPMEGRSLVPAFAGGKIQRDALYWEHEGNAAIRVGDRKLVRLGREGAWELYDPVKDRTEQNDLAAAEPQRVKELSEKWDAWARRTGVIPYPEKKARGKQKGKANVDD
jgi:arylsulfatase